MKLRIIGDVHGHIENYVYLINSLKKCDMSVQLGDMGFKDSYEQLQKAHDFYNIPKGKHRFIGGNHDDYDHRPDQMYSDFGALDLNGKNCFFIRGAESVDNHHRKEGVSWWAAEQLTYKQSMAAIDLYASIKPDIMFTHDCPTALLMFYLTNPMKGEGNSTNELLQQCFDIHKPKFWYFGHHHNTKVVEYKGTIFHCLDELSYIDLEI
jgi:predicted phosphodiesterase